MRCERVIPSLMLFATMAAAASEETVGEAISLKEHVQLHDHAHLVEQPMPEFPMAELVRNREGWVLISYTVLKDGSVFSPTIMDSSGSEAFEKAAIGAVEQWRYVPGAEVVETVLVNFVYERSYPQVSKKFYFRNDRIHRSIEKGKFDDAVKRLEKMRDKDDLTAYELAYSYITEGRVYGEQGDKAGQLQHFRKAMINDGRWLRREDYLKLLRASVVLELQLKDYSSAMRDYALLSETGPGREVSSDLEQPMLQLEGMIASDAVELTDPYVPADIEVFIQRERLIRPTEQEGMPRPEEDFETEQRQTPPRQEPEGQGG